MFCYDSEMKTNPIDPWVEQVCALGCDEVRHIIRTLEAGRHHPATADLAEEHRPALLAELKTIMAVYDRPGRDKNAPFPP